MDIAAARDFGLGREATIDHIRKDLGARSEKATGQKDHRPKGFVENAPVTALLLSPRSMADMLLRRALSAAHFWRNSNIQSFLTGCQRG